MFLAKVNDLVSHHDNTLIFDGPILMDLEAESYIENSELDGENKINSSEKGSKKKTF